MKRSLCLLMLSLAFVAAADAIEPGEPGTHDGPPRLDMLVHVQICPVDGAFYLTGTAGTFDKTGKVDFDYNRGAPLWMSTDLRNWSCLGYVWDRPTCFNAGRPKIGFWLDWNAPAERIDALLAQATTTPKVYQLNSEWYLVCSMNGQAILLQKSATGKPEGPYDDFAVLATRGGCPSIFSEDADTHYLVFADAWIARMAPDLTLLAEAPCPLLPKPGPDPAANRLTVGDAGVSLFKHEGRYGLFAPRWRVHQGKPSHDAVLWCADSVYGPYSETSTVLVGAGPVTVFKHGDAWKAVSAKPGKDTPRIIPFTFE